MLSEAKHLAGWVHRCFVEFTLERSEGLSMTAPDLSGAEELSSAFEPCLTYQVYVKLVTYCFTTSE